MSDLIGKISTYGVGNIDECRRNLTQYSSMALFAAEAGTFLLANYIEPSLSSQAIKWGLGIDLGARILAYWWDGSGLIVDDLMEQKLGEKIYDETMPKINPDKDIQFAPGLVGLIRQTHKDIKNFRANQK